MQYRFHKLVSVFITRFTNFALIDLYDRLSNAIVTTERFPAAVHDVLQNATTKLRVFGLSQRRILRPCENRIFRAPFRTRCLTSTEKGTECAETERDRRKSLMLSKPEAALRFVLKTKRSKRRFQPH
ncbi:hypothetical protein PUN28_004754 [Cardiocondyla obscurior]|uniref:Uncharacterized protein n=1 Tax=Cardiocondyla obscurior TaxID=286306 RepID=A0AAW2GE96_9HYME